MPRDGRSAIGRSVRNNLPTACAAHVPEEHIALLLELFSVVLDGRNSEVTHGVEQALGRPARDFADYARRTAATGVWRA